VLAFEDAQKLKDYWARLLKEKVFPLCDSLYSEISKSILGCLDITTYLTTKFAKEITVDDLLTLGLCVENRTNHLFQAAKDVVKKKHKDMIPLVEFFFGSLSFRELSRTSPKFKSLYDNISALVQSCRTKFNELPQIVTEKIKYFNIKDVH